MYVWEGDRHSLLLCVWDGRIDVCKINTTCVYVREGGSKCLHSLILYLCVVRRVDRVCVCAGRGDLLLAPILQYVWERNIHSLILCVCEMERETEILQSLI